MVRKPADGFAAALARAALYLWKLVEAARFGNPDKGDDAAHFICFRIQSLAKSRGSFRVPRHGNIRRMLAVQRLICHNISCIGELFPCTDAGGLSPGPPAIRTTRLRRRPRR